MTSESIDSLWDFNEPSESESRFRQAIIDHPESSNEIKTQLARSLGLQMKFDEARTVLSELGEPSEGILRVRWHLEFGRVENSSRNKLASVPHFEAALNEASRHGFDFYAVDAAHMLGIVEAGVSGLEWNLKAIAMAEASADERARGWLGSLLNNTAWSLHDLNRADEALALFEKALAFRIERNQPANIRIAQWCVARCLRTLGRSDEALELQNRLLDDEPSGYVYEELGEICLLKGDRTTASGWFAKAYESLGNDKWMLADQPERLARILELSKG